MSVVHISKYVRTGGAAIVASRLFQAQRNNSMDAVFLIQASEGIDIPGVTHNTRSVIKKGLNLWRFMYERIKFFMYSASKEVRFMFSTAITGETIARRKLLRKADIIHLHWLNGGFISLRGLKQILSLGIPVVWTLHDMWVFTGGCHYTGDCMNYKSECGDCHYLRRKHKKDLSHRVWKQKANIFRENKFTIITSSNWLRECAASSSLLGGFKIHVLPNPIDHNLYRPVNKEKSRIDIGLGREKKIILFGAQNIRNIMKGFIYFQDAVNILFDELDDRDNVEVVIFGKSTSEVLGLISFRTHDFSIISSTDRLIELYNAAHVMVVPSIQDNLPSTVMESLSCGTPVVGFRSGGIPDMIDHKVNGYLAESRSAEDLARGIKWILEHHDYEALTNSARNKVLNNFTEKKISERCSEIYREILGM